MNDLRKQQLKQLAIINGTLRENDTLKYFFEYNCLLAISHLLLILFSKLKVIEESKTIITNTIICSVCGGAGHISSDCKMKNIPAAEKPLTWQEREKMDTEVCFEKEIKCFFTF